MAETLTSFELALLPNGTLTFRDASDQAVATATWPVAPWQEEDLITALPAISAAGATMDAVLAFARSTLPLNAATLSAIFAAFGWTPGPAV
jgi:hypothetical protein